MSVVEVILIFSGSIIVSFSSSSQEKTEVDYVKHYNYANEADFYYYTNELDSAIFYYEKSFDFALIPHPVQYQRYSFALWSTKRYDEAMKVIERFRSFWSIDSTKYPGIRRADFERLNTLLAHNRIEKPAIEFYNNFIDSLMEMDQLTRRNYDGSPQLLEVMIKQDSLNRIAYLNFTKKYGAPGGVNAGWNQSIGAFYLHLPKEWLLKHANLLQDEIKKGNIEPWCLAQSLDRMLAEGEKGNITSPNGYYYKETKENPDVIFKNCVLIGASPYFNSPQNTRPSKSPHFNYFQANKFKFNCTK